MPNIMLLAEQARDIVSKMEDLTPEEFLQEMKEIEQKGMQAVAPLCDVIDELGARSKARTDKANDLLALAKADSERIANIKKSIMWIMNACNTDKFDNGSLHVKLNKGRESLEVFDETLVPDKYKKLTVVVPGDQRDMVETVFEGKIIKLEAVVSKTAIKEEIANYAKENEGQSLEIAGTSLVRNPTLTIKG